MPINSLNVFLLGNPIFFKKATKIACPARNVSEWHLVRSTFFFKDYNVHFTNINSWIFLHVYLLHYFAVLAFVFMARCWVESLIYIPRMRQCYFSLFNITAYNASHQRLFLGHTRTGYLLFSKTFQIALDMYKKVSPITPITLHTSHQRLSGCHYNSLLTAIFLHNNIHTHISCIHADDIDLILRGAINRVCPPPPPKKKKNQKKINKIKLGNTLASNLWYWSLDPVLTPCGKAGSWLPLVTGLQYLEPWPTISTGFLHQSNNPSQYNQYRAWHKHWINKS